MQPHQTATTPIYPSADSNQKTGMFKKLIQVLGEEISDLHPRYLIARLLLAPLPDYSFTRVRVHVLRLAGFKDISSKATMWGLPTITGPDNIYARLKIGDVSRFNIGCLFNLGADITIGDNVAFGHNVTILTETHEIGPPSSRSGPLIAKPVKIGHGCWIGANATILPGVTIGDGTIIAANALVTKDIPANTIAAGMPARVVRQLPEDEQE